jgi:hypothetical protein
MKIKPYKCSTCSKFFRHASQLSVHKKSHLKQKPSNFLSLSVVEEVLGKSIFELSNEQVLLPNLREFFLFSLQMCLNLISAPDSRGLFETRGFFFDE